MIHKDLAALNSDKSSGADDPFMLQIPADFLEEPIKVKPIQGLPDFEEGGPGGRGQLTPCEF